MFSNTSTPWIDAKYVKLLALKLDRFKVIREEPILANFRCPECGDSAQNKWKARGYLYKTSSGGVNFVCHNCGSGMGIKKFLKKHDIHLYEEYVMETMKERSPSMIVEHVEKIHKKIIKSPEGLISMSSLNPFHPAIKYWKSRFLPEDRMVDAYWTEDYCQWVNDKVIPDKFDLNKVKSVGRIVLPVRNHENNITGYTGRSINNDKTKYISITENGYNSLGFYGSELVAPDEVRYVVEGPIDSMFLPKCVALMGVSRTANYKNAIQIFDNEPRNNAVINKIKKTIKASRSVVIWDKKYDGLKDLNDIIMSGVKTNELKRYIDSRAFSGARAMIEIAMWAKL